MHASRPVSFSSGHSGLTDAERRYFARATWTRRGLLVVSVVLAAVLLGALEHGYRGMTRFRYVEACTKDGKCHPGMRCHVPASTSRRPHRQPYCVLLD